MSEEQLSEAVAAELMRSLLHKEGSWVDWGKTCQRLQKAGYNSQAIFEATGFQSSQQNLVIVAAQVYDSISTEGASEEILNYCQGPCSDVLYELRILNQKQRVQVAELVVTKRLTAETAKEVARAVQEMSRFPELPPGFSAHPGDAIAYQYWKRARQKKDLQERSRLIAAGLKFAHSPSARTAIEQLLSDFTVVPKVTAPLLPLYVVPIPGWQTILKATDPVAIFAQSDFLPQVISSQPETVLIVIDRNLTTWDNQSYFLVVKDDGVDLNWSETHPNLTILGQVILILRPKRILDENNLIEPWQMDD